MPEPTQKDEQQFLGDLIGSPQQPDPGDDTANAGMSRRQWLAAAAGVVGAGALGYFKGEDAWNWVQTDVLEVPAAIRDAYRDPNMTRDIVVAREGRYPYPESTLEVYAREEKRLFPGRVGVDDAITVATNIANRVAVQAQELVKTQVERGELEGPATKWNVEKSLKHLGSTEEGLNAYMKLIAKELIRAGCFYKIEGSLETAMDERRHNDSKFHLDCDLLCHVALHAASRHDMPIHGVRAPGHMYVGSPDYRNFAIEMTAFRGERVSRVNGLRQESYISIGAGFTNSQGAMQSHFHQVSSAEAERLGYFKPLNIQEIQEGAVGNLLIELLMEGMQDRDPAKLEYICAIGDRELRRFEGKDLVAQNVYGIHSLARDYYAIQWQRSEKGDEEMRQSALHHARRLERLKESHGQFLASTGGRRDQQILDDLERGAPGPTPQLADEPPVADAGM